MHNINSLIMDKKCSKHVSCKEARSILLVTPDNKNHALGPERPARTESSGYRATTDSPTAFVLVSFVEFLYFDIDTVIL